MSSTPDFIWVLRCTFMIGSCTERLQSLGLSDPGRLVRCYGEGLPTRGCHDLRRG